MSLAISRSTIPLISQPNGSPQIYWSGPQSYLAFQASVALFLNLFVVFLSNAKWRIRGQYSLDGTVWQNVGSTGYIDGLSAASSSTGAFTYQYIATGAELQAQFRIGLEITGADTITQGTAPIVGQHHGLNAACHRRQQPAHHCVQQRSRDGATGRQRARYVPGKQNVSA